MQAEMPESPVLSNVLIDYRVRDEDFEGALSEIDKALKSRPEDLELYRTRLVLLERMGDVSGVESQLREMVAAFPDNDQVRGSLIRWYLSRGNVDAAEAFLRERAEAEPETVRDLIQFLARFVGADAALSELDRVIAAGRDDLELKAMRAGLRFSAGDREAAIEELTALIETTEPSDERRRMQVALAKMLGTTGNQVGARALVEEVLAEDESNVEALKMRAEWLIAQDETDEAIIALRRALDQSPRDPDVLTLMAAAHERAGSRDLMGEMLALATEASNNAPEETLRYVRFLRADGKLDAAETALIDALRLAPADVDLLRALGAIHVANADWPRAEQVASTLERLDDDDAKNAANGLRAAILAGQNKTSDVIAFLENLVESGEAGLGAQVAILRTYIQNGNLGAARAYVDRALEEKPDDTTLKFLAASLDEIEGDVAKAETAYRALVEERPDAALAWRGAVPFADARRPPGRGNGDARRRAGGEPGLARPALGEGICAAAAGTEGGGDRDLRAHVRAAKRLAAGRQQPRQPADHGARRRGEPGTCLCGGPPPARFGRAGLSGHLWLDRLSPRRIRRGPDPS